MDLEADMRGPISLAQLFATSAEVEAELLGLTSVPSVELTTGVVRSMGEVVREGRPLPREAQVTVFIGPGVRDPEVEVIRNGQRHVLLMVTELGPVARLTAMPRREATSIVTALAIVLAAALSTSGSFADIDFNFRESLGFDTSDPVALIAATRLPMREQPVQEAALTYLRQFPHLEGWPPR